MFHGGESHRRHRLGILGNIVKVKTCHHITWAFHTGHLRLICRMERCIDFHRLQILFIMCRLEFSRQLFAPVSFKGIWPPSISTQQVCEAKHVAADGKQQITFDQGPEEKHYSLPFEEATSKLQFMTPCRSV